MGLTKADANAELRRARLIERTGATMRQVDTWGRQGLYVDDRPVIGSGFRRRYCEADVRRTLVAMGVSPFGGANNHGPNSATPCLVPLVLTAIGYADSLGERFAWFDGLRIVGVGPDRPGVAGTVLRIDTRHPEPGR